jgi:type I restriction enzyme M protein
VDRIDRSWIEGRARELRVGMPDAEVILWSFIQKRQLLGYKFRRQYVVGRAILDFYCPERRLAVEIDWAEHDPEQDEARDAWLASQGIHVLRFSNLEIYHQLFDVLADIANHLEERPAWRLNKRLR